MRNESKERNESAKWEVLTHDTLITQQSVLPPNTERQINVPFLSRRERLRRSLQFAGRSRLSTAKNSGTWTRHCCLLSLDCRLTKEIRNRMGSRPPIRKSGESFSCAGWILFARFYPRVFGGVSALHRAYCEWGFPKAAFHAPGKVPSSVF